jgi:uncharacterized protein involved in outer membrane biogenesis
MLKKILIGVISLVSLVLLLVISLFAYLQFADLNRYKPQISQRLTQYINRSVVIDGNFELKIVPLSISLTDVKIENVSWGSQPDMLSVHQLDLQLGLLALLSGEFLIHKFLLDDVKVLVEHNEQGENNWRLREPTKSQASTTKATKESTSLPLDFVSDVEVDIRNITLAYSQSPASPLHEYILNKATLNGLSDRSALQIDISGQIDGHLYQLNGQTGILADLLSSDKSFPVDLQAQVLNTAWEIKGAIQSPLKLERMQFNVKANAKDLTVWQQWLGVSIKKGPVNINADIDGNLNRLSVTNLGVQIGNTAASGDVTLDLSAEKPNIRTQLKVKDVHIKEFIQAIQPESTTKNKPVTQAAEEKPLNKELDLSFLNLFDASVQLSVNSVGYEGWAVDQLNADLNIKDGQLSVAPFSIESQLGQAKGTFSLVEEQGMNVAKLEIDAKNLALGKFFDMASTYQGIGALQGNLHTKGKSLSNLYANLQGNAIGRYVNQEHKHATKIVLTRSDPKTSAAPFDVAIDGELQKVPYKITGDIGGPLALISDKPYPVTAQLKFLNVDAKAKGTIAELFEAKGFNINVDARTSHLANLEKTLDIGLPTLKKAQVKTVFRGDYSLLKFDHIRVKGSNVRLSGHVHVDFEKQLPNIFGNINIDELDLISVQKEMARVKKSESSKEVKGEKGALVKNATLTETMSFSALQDFNMNIKLTAKDGSINLPIFPVSKASAEIKVADSALSVWRINIESPVGNMKSYFKINAKSKVPSVDARLKSSELDLEKIELDKGEQILHEAIASADVSLHANGDSLQQWLESVGGEVTLNYEHKQMAQAFAIQLARDAEKIEVATPVTVRINSKVKDTIFPGSGSVSAPLTWLVNDQPTSFNLQANIKGFVTEVQGKIDDPISGKGMDIQVSVNNVQAFDSSQSQNELVSRVGRVKVTSEVKGDYSSIVASKLEGTIGEGRITGSTSINMRQQPIAWEFDWNIYGLDISKWAAGDKTIKTKNKPKTKPKTEIETDIQSETDTEIGKEGGRKLFSSEQLPFELLKDVNIKGKIKGKNMQLLRLDAREFDASVDLKDGVLRLSLDRLLAANGSLNADVVIDSRAVPPGVSVKMDVPKINMSEVVRNTATEGLVNGNFGAELAVSSAGNSLADLMAGVNGHVRLLVDEGSIDSALFNIYTGGLGAMVGMITVKKEKSTKINCGICGFKFNNGKGVTEVALLDTKHSTLVAEGWVDFNNETFSLKASPVGKGLQLNVNLPVIIEGPFSNPGVSTEASSALFRAAEIATVWFVPSTAIFIGYDQLRTSDQNPCVNMVAPNKDGIGMRTLKGAGKAVKDIGSAFNKSLSKILGDKGGAEPQVEDVSDNNE